MNHNIVHISEVEDGDIFEIVSWHNDHSVGYIAQRWDIALIIINQRYGKSYKMFFDSDMQDLKYKNNKVIIHSKCKDIKSCE